MTTPANAAVVIGLGRMGCDIAAIFLAGGYRVIGVEPSRDAWPAAQERARTSVEQLGGDAKAAGNLDIVADLDAVNWDGIAAVVECAPENLALKQTMFVDLDTRVPAGIPIGSNSSSMRITDIAGDCKTRDRMANLHFFLPAHIVPAVEVVRGEHTDPAVCEKLAALMKALGRVPIIVNRDVPGFLANRIQHALMREAFSVIDEGLADADAVDAAVRYAFGFRYVAAGPILQKEFAGLHTQLAAAATIYPSLANNTEPSPTLARLVAEGRTGTAVGKGFRDWTPERVTEERDRYERILIEAAKLLEKPQG